MTLAILFGLLTALSNALAVSSQHIASTRGTESMSGWRVVRHLLVQPLWLAGWVAMGGSLVFQSLALHFGAVSVVQPLLVSELIIALVLRRLWLGQAIRATTWWAALVTGAGLVAFLAAAAPSAGRLVPSTRDWIIPSTIVFVAVAILVVLAQRGTPGRRAALFASATAAVWAIEAAYIKATTDVLSAHGLGALFVHWPLYALFVAGVIGLLCEQTALHVGPLSVSQPAIVILDPVVSVALGLVIYQERLQVGWWHLALAGAAFAVMCVGVVQLTRSAPATMNRDVHRM